MRFLAAVAREIAYWLGEYGGQLVEAITHDAAREEARIKAEFYARYEGE